MAAPWDKTNSEIIAEDRARRKALEYSRNRAKPTWAQGSVTSTEAKLQQRDRDEASRYSYATPWQIKEDNIMADFEKQVSALDYSLKVPWEGPDEDISREPQVSNYKYEPLWEPVQMPRHKQEQIENYEYCPPYRCEFNGIPEKHARNRKVIPGHTNASIPPWAHGSLPGPPIPKNMHHAAPTSLWEAPKTKPIDNSVESSGDPILDSLRMQLKARGASGICGLARKFKVMDDDGSGALNIDEFTKAMNECKIVDLSKAAIAHLFRYFDKDDSGTITYDEFLVGVRGVLNKRRRDLVHMAFDILDQDGSGIVTIDDIRSSYDTKMHPMVIAGKMTEEDVLRELLDNFDVGGGAKDGLVTLQEFENYYSNVSSSVDSDDYFELMMRNAWHISGGEGWCANTTNKRVLVTHADGRQTVEEVKNDIGLKSKDKAGLAARLKAQGIDAAAINTNGSAGMDQAADPFANRPQRASVTSQAPQVQSQLPPLNRNSVSSSSQQSQLRPQNGQQQLFAQTQRPASAAGKPKTMSLTATMGSISSADTRGSRAGSRGGGMR